MNPELDKIIEEADNPLEALFAAFLYYMIEMIFKMVEVVIEFGTNTQESNQRS